MISRMKVLCLLLPLAVLSGCASVPLATASDDSAAKQFTPVQDKSVVYIYRNESLGGAIKIDLFVDNNKLGETAPHTYFRVELPAGHHVISAGGENNATLEMDTQAGQVYYVWQEMKMGFVSARAALHLMDAKQGQDAVKDCKLATGAF